MGKWGIRRVIDSIKFFPISFDFLYVLILRLRSYFASFTGNWLFVL